MKKPEPVTRCSISLPPQLLEALDQMSADKGYDNRSLAIADMIRDQLVEYRKHTGSGEMAGTISLVYDHHHSHLQERLTEIQHDFGKTIIATLHVHLDHDNCLEVLVARSSARQLKELANRLIATKGVKHGRLSMTTTGRDMYR